MTTRRWMIAVAVVAVVRTGAVLFRRHLALRRLADYHENMERRQARKVEGILELSRAAAAPKDAVAARADAATEARFGDWHARIKEKYRRAARYPWLPVEPDPPKPENPLKSEDLHNVDVPGLP
jgi:hypothetical protein